MIWEVVAAVVAAVVAVVAVVEEEKWHAREELDRKLKCNVAVQANPRRRMQDQRN